MFELSKGRFVLLCLVLFLSYLWVFGLGITIGRSVIVREDRSFLKRLALFLGYRQPEKDMIWQADASRTWIPPEQMEQELGYYSALISRAREAPKNAETPYQKEPEKEETGREKGEENSVSELASAAQPAEEKVYTVLAASFKNPENAKRLMALLKSKGYPVSVEQVYVRDSVWHRVVVGSFQSKEDALKFLSMFNSKEGLQGIVVQK